MNKTAIPFLTHTWNPTHGCTAISEGCRSCWAETMSKRLAGMGARGYSKKDPFKPRFCSWELEKPLKVRKSSVIGTSFMGDLFHENMPFRLIAAIFGVMSFCQEHTFLVLTKRPYRMVEFFNDHHNGDYNRNFNWWLNEACLALADNMTKGIRLRPKPDKFPLPNVWLGVSAENQNRFDERWSILAQISAAKRFVSLEPLLSGIILKSWCPSCQKLLLGSLSETCGTCFTKAIRPDWIIAGCESGPNRRQAQTHWFRALKDQCVDAGVPFFLKQMEGIAGVKCKIWGIRAKSTVVKMPFLDGEIWNQMP